MSSAPKPATTPAPITELEPAIEAAEAFVELEAAAEEVAAEEAAAEEVEAEGVETLAFCPTTETETPVLFEHLSAPRVLALLLKVMSAHYVFSSVSFTYGILCKG